MNNIKVKRIDKETNKVEIIDMQTAINKLDGYWDKNSIEPELLKGTILFTPYADYVIETN